jgi:hypothetical protein
MFGKNIMQSCLRLTEDILPVILVNEFHRPSIDCQFGGEFLFA